MDRVHTLTIEEKGKNDFVSEIDRAAEAAIIDTILHIYPDHAILGEESGAIETDSSHTWIIDPLDGTMNFLQGIPHFSISIGIKVGGTLEHGVIVDPVRSEEFLASRGHGAQLNGKRIRVTGGAKLDQSIVSTGIPYRQLEDHLDAYSEILTRLTASCRSIRRMGSAALDLAYLAAGRTDGLFHVGISPWDMAAGTVIVREAGGFVGDIAGGDRFMDTGNLVAGNPRIFREMMKVIRSATADAGDTVLARG